LKELKGFKVLKRMKKLNWLKIFLFFPFPPARHRELKRGGRGRKEENYPRLNRVLKQFNWVKIRLSAEEKQ